MSHGQLQSLWGAAGVALRPTCSRSLSFSCSTCSPVCTRSITARWQVGTMSSLLMSALGSTLATSDCTLAGQAASGTTAVCCRESKVLLPRCAALLALSQWQQPHLTVHRVLQTKQGCALVQRHVVPTISGCASVAFTVPHVRTHIPTLWRNNFCGIQCCCRLLGTRNLQLEQLSCRLNQRSQAADLHCVKDSRLCGEAQLEDSAFLAAT